MIPVLACMLGGCFESADSPTTVANSAGDIAVGVPTLATLQDLWVGERDFTEMAAVEPSFAGYFREGDVLIALSSDPSRHSEIRAAIGRRPAFLRDRGSGKQLGPPGLEVRNVSFSYLQLSEWRARVFEHVLHVPDVVELDLDERRNRLKIGLESGEGAAEVYRLLAALDIPRSAVELDITGPSYANQMAPDSLGGYYRPLRGGIFIRQHTLRGFLAGCTLGFHAVLGGTDVFVTNSHCTADVFGADRYRTNSHQKLFDPQNLLFQRIGTEWFDPPGFRCNSRFSGRPCRWTDSAAFLREPALDSVDFGYIARTTYRSTGPQMGSVLVDQAHPRFKIVGKASRPLFGDWVNKMGPRAGWTYGQVIETCSWRHFKNLHGTDFSVICAYKADYRGDKGDSGSPIFLWSEGDDVVLQGLHIGSDNAYRGLFGEGSGRGWFSPIGLIEEELGELTVGVEPPLPLAAHIVGDSPVPPGEKCRWSAIVNHGVPPYSYRWSGALLGADSSISGWLDTTDRLYLTVTDAAQARASDQLLIEVDQTVLECIH